MHTEQITFPCISLGRWTRKTHEHLCVLTNQHTFSLEGMGRYLFGWRLRDMLTLVSQLRITLTFSADDEINDINYLSPKGIAYWAIFCTWVVHHAEIIPSDVWYSSNHSTLLTLFLLKDIIGCIYFLSDKHKMEVSPQVEVDWCNKNCTEGLPQVYLYVNHCSDCQSCRYVQTVFPQEHFPKDLLLSL